jgi:hypothetical protein
LLRSTCRALLVLNILYCAAALVEDRMPAWKMFESGERLEWSLTDRDGRAVAVEEVLPDGAYVLSYAELERVARFACAREPMRAPLTLVERTHGTTRIDCAH